MMAKNDVNEMSESLVIPNQNGQNIAYPPKLLNVIRRTVAKNSTDEELFMFLSLAQKYQLDPFAKEIWFIKYAGGETRIETSRDGYLTVAKRDPGFLGIQSFPVHKNDEFEMKIKKGEVVDVEHNFKHTERGELVGAWAVVKHVNGNSYEYLPLNESKENTAVWKKHPTLMMKKVVEVAVLKRVAGISGLVTAEEMGTDVEEVTKEIEMMDEVPELPETDDSEKESKPTKKSKPKRKEPTLTAEAVEKLFKKCPKLKEAFKDIVDYENTIPKLTMLRKADQLLQDEEITQENFNELKKLI